VLKGLSKMKYKIIFAYDGSKFFGYSVQKNEEHTIQAVIEKTLSTILNKATKIYASGRTDKGVHALNQVATFETKEEINTTKVLHSLNKMISNDIYFKSLKLANDNFDARFSAKSKTYEYVINTKEYNPFLRKYEVYIKDIDTKKMKECAKVFVGKHCFKNFTSKPTDTNDFVRNIFSIKFLNKKDHLIIEFTGDGFMTYMVRKLMGAMIEVSKGTMSVQEVKDLLDAKERTIITYTSVPQALFLKKVSY
jgi:tRNA pseudouridine38-40 synthase